MEKNPTVSKMETTQKQLLIEVMNEDAKDGLYEDGTPYPFASGPIDNRYKLPINPTIPKMETTETGNFYPIWISSEKYKKLLCIQTKPKLNIWYKDEEINYEELIEILNK